MSASAIELPSHFSFSSAFNNGQPFTRPIVSGDWEYASLAALLALATRRMRPDHGMCGSFSFKFFLLDLSLLFLLFLTNTHTHFYRLDYIAFSVKWINWARDKKIQLPPKRKRERGGKIIAHKRAHRGDEHKWRKQTSRQTERSLLNRCGHTRTDQMHFQLDANCVCVCACAPSQQIGGVW